MVVRNVRSKFDLLLVEAESRSYEAIIREIPPEIRFLAVGSTKEADLVLDHAPVRVLVCADDLPGESGLMFLGRIRQRWPGMHRILLVPALDPNIFFHAMQTAQLFRCLDKPLKPGTLGRAIHQSLRNITIAPLAHSPAVSPPVIDPTPPEKGFAGGMLLGVLVCAVALGPLTLFLIAYLLKSIAGIDIFPDSHLKDLFP